MLKILNRKIGFVKINGYKSVSKNSIRIGHFFHIKLPLATSELDKCLYSSGAAVSCGEEAK
jgi:hypothetical protein